MQAKRYFPLVLLIISFIPLFDFFHSGLPVTHDGQDHVARIANFYQNLSEGNIVPRWAANLNWGYGHPILMFLYPLPSYFASLFHFLSFSLADSTKIVFGVAYILSGIAMYLWVKEFLGKRAAFLSSLLYLFAPYRFVDLYVRGAIGEHVAFVFPPLIFYFLLKLSKRFSYWYILGGSISVGGLILSHNAISLMFFPLIFLYAIYLLWQAKGRSLLAIRYTLYAILGFGFSAFFWIPAFFEGKYTLRDIVTVGEYVSRFVNFQSLIFGPWNYGGSGQFTTQVGIVQWLMVIASIPIAIKLRANKNSLWILIVSTLVIFWLSLFLMTEQSRFVWDKLTTLQKFQFPWRFFSITVFTAAVLGGIFISTLPKKFQIAACYLVLVALLFFNKEYWYAKDYLEKQESFFTAIYPGTTDTGESSPRWSVRFMEREPKAHIEIISGNAKIKEGRRTSTIHEYHIEVLEKARISENTLYFPGWQVYVEGQETHIEFQDPAYRGLMTFMLDKGSHRVVVRFQETKLRQFANAVSVGTIVITFFVSLFLWKKLSRKRTF